MKKITYYLPYIFPIGLIFIGLNTVAYCSPSDVEAAWAWNLAIVLAPVAALIAQWKMARERQMPLVLTLAAIAILNTSIMLGSRLGAWNGNDWVRALSGNGLPELAGKTIMGGLLLMLLVYLLLQRWWRLPAGMADVLMLGLPIAAAVGRVGCLLAGCCYGLPTHSDWGICYGPGSPAFLQQSASGILPESANATPFLFPIQLFLMAGNLFIFLFLWKNRARFPKPGALAFLGFGLLTLQRFGIEFFRDVATNRGGFGYWWAGLKAGQWVMLLLALCSFAGFLWIQRSGTSVRPQKQQSTKALPIHQAYALTGVTFACWLLREVLTFDEALVILISCAPAIGALGNLFWKEHRIGRSIIRPATLLSATTLLLMANPLDSIAPVKRPKEGWKNWIEVGAGGTSGSYKEIIRGCDGAPIGENIIKYQSGGGEISSNWQRGTSRFQVAVKGAWGKEHSNDTHELNYNFKFSSIGFIGRLNEKYIGLSLGIMNRHRVFDPRLRPMETTQNATFPFGALRIGRTDRYSVDFRFYDEPVPGLGNQPPFSLGVFNWGFGDPSGNTFLRGGLAYTGTGESAVQLSTSFPLGESGLSTQLSGYVGRATMFGLGLRYRFDKK